MGKDLLVDTPDRLAVWAREIERASWVAMDTEADSLHAYPEKLCLVQIATPVGEVLVDPLAGMDMASLKQALQPHILILHGGDYDLRLLYRSWGFIPTGVFDTMLAARLLGIKAFGLDKLVKDNLGVQLEKGPQRANWARRPLTERMIEYARSDASYLKPLADRLAQDLAARGRSEWHAEMCRRLIRECARDTEVDPDEVWRLSGAHRLDRRGLAVLRELWHWREREARRLCRPPYFVLPHEHLVRMAEAVGQGAALDSVLPKRTSPNRRAALAVVVAAAQALREDQWPRIRRSKGLRLSLAQRQRQADLQARRDQAAAQLGLDPSLIASRAALVRLAVGSADEGRELMAWQRDLLLGEGASC